jgi:predicted Ser/Thr protein kinase
VTAPSANSASTVLQSLRARLADRYLIERELGRGGMGAVYLGRDIRLDRLVALKVLPSEFAVQQMLRDRFLRETRTAAGFSHPNIVPVYAVEESADLLAYAMGYVEGESLMERVSRAGPLSVREIVKLMQDVAYALAYANGRGIVHRDIKPDNIMIERASGRALVMDFGIARAKSTAPVQAEGLTRVGEVVGTPEYMSPEQACGDDVDGRSDLYSLGLTIIFAATGKNAVQADSTQKVLMKQLTEVLPPIATLRAGLPDVLADAIDRCVRKDPAERFDSAEQLGDALDSSQLAHAEIPLSIRLFEQDASTLSFVILASAICSLYLLQSINLTAGNEKLLIVVVVAAVVAMRVLQTLAEARRMAIAGFSPAEITAGMTLVMDERETQRTEFRADPIARLARRRSIIIGVGLVLFAGACFRAALMFRHQIHVGYYSVDPIGSAFIIASMASLGAGTVLLFKSPLRMGIGERLFRAVWLGPIGRAFVRFGGRKSATRRAPRHNSLVTQTHAKSHVSTINRVRTPAVVAGVSVAEAQALLLTVSVPDIEQRLNSIERRLGQLERE